VTARRRVYRVAAGADTIGPMKPTATPRHLALPFVLLLSAVFAAAAEAEEPKRRPKLPVYAEVGLGLGQTLFFGDMQPALRSALGGAFDPGLGMHVMAGFTVAPDDWLGCGLGSRIKGTFGSPIEGEGGDAYVFNYYNLALTATCHPLESFYDEGGFGVGPLIRLSAGFGQMTTKRLDDAALTYRHQYAIGPSLMAAVGYAQPLGPLRLTIELEFEYASRNGTVEGVGSVDFQSGQLGANLTLGF